MRQNPGADSRFAAIFDSHTSPENRAREGNRVSQAIAQGIQEDVADLGLIARRDRRIQSKLFRFGKACSAFCYKPRDPFDGFGMNG